MNNNAVVVREKSEIVGESLPSPEDINRLLAAVTRPFVIASDRELSVLRRGLTKPGWKRSLYLQDPPEAETKLAGAGLLCVANRWLDAEVEIPEPGGHYHDFFCDDGTLLDFRDVSDADGPGYRCPACGRTYHGEEYDRAHKWFRHFELAAGCLALGLVYQIDRDQEYAERALEILGKYAAANPIPRISATEGGMLSQSLDEAAWIIMLAQAYDLVYHSKSVLPEARAAIEENLFRATVEGFRVVPSYATWEAYHASALGVVGCALKDSQMVSEGVQRVISQIDSDLDENGLWPESIHTHHFFALTAYVHLAEACYRVGINLFDYVTRSGKSLQAMFLGPLAYAYPSFQLPAVGDGWFHSPLPMALYEVAYRRWNDPAFAWVLRTGYSFAMHPVNSEQVEHRDQYTRSSLYAFLFGRDLPGRAPAPRLISADFSGPGIMVVRSDYGAMLTFDYGQKRTITIPRRDLLNVTLYANDKLLLADYGTPGWGSAVTEYYRSTAAHNTVVVDGRSQQPVAAPVPVDLHSGIYLHCIGACSEVSYPGVTHTRQVMMVGEVVFVMDELESQEEHTYDWLIHSEGRLVECPPQQGEATGVSPYFTDVQSHGEHANCSLRWEFDGSGLAGWFATDGPGEVITASGLTETSARMSSVLNLRQRGCRARYMALLYPHSTQNTPTIERHGSGFKITCGDTTDWIYLSNAPAQVDGTSEIESDAQLAAIRKVNGKMMACGICHGSYLKLLGEQVLYSPGTFERAEVRMEGRNPVITFDGATGDHIKLKCHARAMRVNGYRISASCFDGTASIRIAGVLAE